MLSPCPQCHIELFSRRLLRRPIEGASGKTSRTTCCPECGVPLQTDLTARRLAVASIFLGGLVLYLITEFVTPVVGLGWATVAKSLVLAIAGGVFLYSVVAFPYVRQKP